MSVTEQTPVNAFTANGVTTVFNFTFLLLSSDDLVVYVDDVVQTIGADYTVSGVGVPAGGSVTFIAAPASSANVVISRSSALQRSTDYQDNGDLLADTFNGDFDRLWLAMQDMNYRYSLSPSLPAGSPLVGMVGLPVDAGKYLRWNVAGTDLEAVEIADVAGGTSLQSMLISADSGQGDAMIAVKASGTGAVARTQHDKNAESVFSGDYATLQNALDAGAGGIVYIEGANEISASLTPSDHTLIEFLPGASVSVAAGSAVSTGDAIFKCNENTGVIIKLHGATLTGERKGTGTDDIVMGVSFLGSVDCVCIGPGTIQNCAGDGGYIGAAVDNTPIYSERCGFLGVRFLNNMRNGVAATSGVDCFADYCTFAGTNGKSPEAGLDVEPEGGSTRMVFRSIGCVGTDNAKFDFLLVLGGNTTPVTTSVGVEILDFIARDSRTYTETVGIGILNHKDTMENDGYVKVRGKCMNINNHGLMLRNIDKDGQDVEFDVELIDTALVAAGSMVGGFDSPCAIYTNTAVASYADPGGLRGKLRVVDNTRDRTPYYINSAGSPWTDIVMSVDWVNTVGKTQFPYMDATTANTYITFTPEPYRVNRTADITISARYSNWVLSNKGAAALVTFTLPAVAVGLKFIFEVFDADGIRIDPNASDRLWPFGTGDGKYIQSIVVGSSAVVYANQDGTDWVVQRFGTWTDEP